ncbi:hypothetical protein [Nonomuraea diastatica]|uniref:Uncharacterized protein n=1 Tax=Nonomuraea diastatica TaxID=1848329 RepID=A0A4R4W5K9_9ACTN|nr:hypothetical protein [Nonomuraea diastatica]TDD11303.1 hypothetical protein E1294_45230 [Nonomuraea diastatica]
MSDTRTAHPDTMSSRPDLPTLLLRMSLACPYSGCGGDSIVATTADGGEIPVYIAEEHVISASVGEDDAECEGFACSDCGRTVSLPPGYTFQRP